VNALSTIAIKLNFQLLTETNAPAISIVIALLALPAIPLLLRIRRGHRRRRWLAQLRASWGHPDTSNRDFGTLQYFHQLPRSRRAQPSTLIDDSTWNDLNMDAVYAAIDRTCSSAGQCDLYQTLRTPLLSQPDLAHRGRLVSLFQQDPATRESIQLELVSLGKSNAAGLIALIFSDQSPPLLPRWLTFSMTALAAIFLAGFAFTRKPYMAVGIMVVFAVNMRLNYRTKVQLMGRLTAMRQLGGLIEAGRRIGQVRHPLLADYSHLLEQAAGRASRIVRKVGMLLPESSSSGEIAATLLEYITIYFLHEVRTFHAVISDIAARRPDLQTLFLAIGQLDTLQSIASFRTTLGLYCEPQFTGASSPDPSGPLDSPSPKLVIQNARHPLLADAITNSIRIVTGGIAITGSNMSGKTTFLKTIGVNVLLAQTIHTCSAASYQAGLMRIISSMNESDDLLSGKSYYLAEAERLLKVIRESETTPPLLAVIDEPLAGTNSPERLAASREILRYLVAHGAVPMLCTHDVELVAQLQKAGDFHPFHFSDLADETGIHFDYQLRPGQNYRGNAIKVLKYLGYPDTITQAAMADHPAIPATDARES
jgi:hypothetical protein